MSDETKKPRSSLWRELDHGEVLRDAAGRGFRILHFLAEGGYSQVYEAEREVDPDSHPHVAVKVLNLKHAKNKKTLRRQMREAEALYELNHPNVVRVHSIGVREDTGMVFMVMDLLVGRTLRELTRDLGGRMPIPWTLQIMVAVCRGLSAIHRMAVHRDLKPENIHTRDDGHISLFDLGTSRFKKEERLTTQGYTIGTLNYMSPEQLSGAEEIDGRSDLFAVGTMLYELLSGENPFAGKDGKRDRQEIGNRIMFRTHVPLDHLMTLGPNRALVAGNVPDYLVAIVERLLRKRPEGRYDTAEGVADLLTAALAKFTLDNQEHPAAPLATIGTVPRTPEPEEGEEPEPMSSVPTSTNPFISISFPPEQEAREAFSSAQPAPSIAYASTEQIAVYALPALASVPVPVPHFYASIKVEEKEKEKEKGKEKEEQESGSDKIYLDLDLLNSTTLAPHAKRLQHERSLPTEQMRFQRAPTVPPIFFFAVGLAALTLAAIFVLGAVGVLGHGPTTRPRPATVAPLAPAPEAAPTMSFELRPQPSAPTPEADAGPPIPPARARSQPAQPRKGVF